MEIYLLKLIGNWLSVLAVSLVSFLGLGDYQEKMVDVENSSIKIPKDTKVAFVAALKETLEVGDHILHICNIEKILGDENKVGLFAWNGFGKAAPAQEK